MRAWRVGVAAVVLSCSLCAGSRGSPGPDVSVRVEVEGQTLTIPAPKGMTSVKGADRTYDQVLAAATPPGMTMHAAFAQEEMWEQRLHRNAPGPPIWNYAFVETGEQGATDPAGVAVEYETERRELRSWYGALSPEFVRSWRATRKALQKRVLEVLGQDVTYESGKPLPLATLQDNDRAFSATHLVKGKGSFADGSTLEYTLIVGTSVLRVRSRLVFLLYFQRLSQGLTEADAAGRALMEWTNAVVAANR